MYVGIDSMRSLWAWGLQVLVLAIVFTLFFGVVVGKRGLVLIVFVTVLSLLPPTLIWLRTRTQSHSH
jgi:hypothetical protein